MERNFYKYTSSATAAIVLKTGRLRYSDPKILNDPYDSQFELSLGIDLKQFKKQFMSRWLKIINSKETHLSSTPSQFALLTDKFRKMRHRIPKTDSEIAESLLGALESRVALLEQLMPTFLNELKTVYEDAKIFCVSEVPNQTAMWTHYADQHKGVVLQLSTVSALDNPLMIAGQVKYVDAIPSLFAVDEFIDLTMTGKNLDTERAFRMRYFTKGTSYSFEREWRVVIPGEKPGALFSDVAFHPLELSAVIFGISVPEAERQKLTEILEALYPHAAVLQARRSTTSFDVEIV